MINLPLIVVLIAFVLFGFPLLVTIIMIILVSIFGVKYPNDKFK